MISFLGLSKGHSSDESSQDPSKGHSYAIFKGRYLFYEDKGKNDLVAIPEFP